MKFFKIGEDHPFVHARLAKQALHCGTESNFGNELPGYFQVSLRDTGRCFRFPEMNCQAVLRCLCKNNANYL